MHMAALKELHEELGFTEVTTYVQSGNVVFRGPDADPWGVARRVEKAIADAMGLKVHVVVRPGEEMLRIAASNPFLVRRGIDPAKLHVTFLASAPAPEKLRSLRAPEGRGDEFAAVGREIYLHCPGGYGRSALTNDRLERALRVQATTRNWNTVCVLAAMAGRLGGQGAAPTAP
jgi:uncharacterized protein (DUF1697 family)